MSWGSAWFYAIALLFVKIIREVRLEQKRERKEEREKLKNLQNVSKNAAFSAQKTQSAGGERNGQPSSAGTVRNSHTETAGNRNTTFTGMERSSKPAAAENKNTAFTGMEGSSHTTTAGNRNTAFTGMERSSQEAVPNVARNGQTAVPNVPRKKQHHRSFWAPHKEETLQPQIRTNSLWEEDKHAGKRIVALRLMEGEAVPQGYVQVKCSYCGADNLVTQNCKQYHSCYFCRVPID